MGHGYHWAWGIILVAYGQIFFRVTYFLNVLSHCSRVRLFVTLWGVARQAPLSMGFLRQENWSGLPFRSPGEFSDPGIKPALAGGFFNTEPPGKHVLGI